jgi:hypothetical protein
MVDRMVGYALQNYAADIYSIKRKLPHKLTLLKGPSHVYSPVSLNLFLF